MAYVATHPSSSTISPSDGSRTIVVYDSQPRENVEQNSDGRLPTEGVLHLRAGTETQPRVTWTEDVVDNEGMGKKKSKICCIYTKNREYNDSSSDSDSNDSDSDSGSDSGGARPGGRLGQRLSHRHSHGSHPHPHDQEGGGGGTTMRDGDGSTTIQELLDDDYERNAYERQPGRKKGKKDKPKSHSQ